MRDRHWSEELTPDRGHGADEMTPTEQARYRSYEPTSELEWAHRALADRCSSAANLRRAHQILAAHGCDTPDQFVD